MEDETLEELDLKITTHPLDGDEVTLIQPMLGLSPYLLVMPREGEIEIHAGGFGGVDELADVLESLAEIIRSGDWATVQDD